MTEQRALALQLKTAFPNNLSSWIVLVQRRINHLTMRQKMTSSEREETNQQVPPTPFQAIATVVHSTPPVHLGIECSLTDWMLHLCLEDSLSHLHFSRLSLLAAKEMRMLGFTLRCKITTIIVVRQLVVVKWLSKVRSTVFFTISTNRICFVCRT